jgi:hypothetical protein
MGQARATHLIPSYPPEYSASFGNFPKTLIQSSEIHPATFQSDVFRRGRVAEKLFQAVIMRWRCGLDLLDCP